MRSRNSKVWRSLVVAFVISSAWLGGGVVQSRIAAAAGSGLSASASASVEDASMQARAFAVGYNLILDHYVHPLDTSVLLRAGWDNLGKEAAGKAAAPGPVPVLTGDRAGDLQAMQTGLATYLAEPSASADGFVAAHAILRGMVRAVSEAHTYFLDPQQYTDYQAWSRGDSTYVGIGISVSARNAQPHIVEVYDDTPAQQAGLRAGDVLIRINDTPVAGLALDEMTALVRGPAGSSVNLVVTRGDDPTQLTFSVQRAEIHLQFVKQRMLDDDIGYVMLRGFPEPSVVDSIDQDVASFEADGAHGLVLDLRGNSGGRIDVGTSLLGHFLPAGSPIYEEVDRNGDNHTHVTRDATQYDLPLVVLVDGGTASMGEIFASAVQEHGAARIVGSITSGSVAAAQVFGLPDGAGLQVTVFEILSADGKPLNKVGVQPDDVIDPSATDVTSGSDPVISHAVDILHAELGIDAQPSGGRASAAA